MIAPDDPVGRPAPPEAVFTEGPVMRHVLVMAATGSVGLVSVFAVDFLSLLYVSRLGDPAAVAGVGFATQVLFFLTSFSIGLAIAVTALVSRAIGAADGTGARRMAASGLTLAAVIATLAAAPALVWRHDLLTLLGAQGAALDVAQRFLLITAPASALLALGMGLGGVLRAAGDARRAMYVTLFGALATAAMDPILIFGLGLGVDGAAWSTIFSRLVFVATGLHGCVVRHSLIARPSWLRTVADLPAVAAIAGPAILTNLAAPVANSWSMRIFAQFGEQATSAFVIVDRITPVAFGAMFALTGAVGPILGQNLGAGLFARVRGTLSDCFALSAGYALAVWALLWLASPHIADLFGASGRTREIVLFFCEGGVAAWVFLGCLFVSNAAFNNLGFPFLATLFNWGRATLGTIPFVTLGARLGGPEGGYSGIIVGAAVFGLGAMAAAYTAVARLERVQTRS